MPKGVCIFGEQILANDDAEIGRADVPLDELHHAVAIGDGALQRRLSDDKVRRIDE